jgi:hypothetical protein
MPIMLNVSSKASPLRCSGGVVDLLEASSGRLGSDSTTVSQLRGEATTCKLQ